MSVLNNQLNLFILEKHFRKFQGKADLLKTMLVEIRGKIVKEHNQVGLAWTLIFILRNARDGDHNIHNLAYQIYWPFELKLLFLDLLIHYIFRLQSDQDWCLKYVKILLNDNNFEI